jgi:hypothetical protein
MATYVELRGLFTDSDLRGKVEVAVVIAANKIASGNDDVAPFDQAAGAHDNRVRWAATAIQSTRAQAENILKLVLADNSDLATSAILSASDAAIQSNVDAVVDMIATAQFAV